MHLFINGLAASAGGGPTYLRNIIPQLSRRADVAVSVLLPRELRREFENAPHIRLIEAANMPGALRRILWEQTKLPDLIRRSGANVLVSAGNFALWSSPVPQILLSRNSLYTSADFRRDLITRRDYVLWADTRVKGWLARQSVARADVAVAPSQAFADELSRWTGKQISVIHHGFDRESFAANPDPLPQTAQAQLDEAQGALRLLFVSHYNYYRNFETLIRALPLLRDRLHGTRLKLFLTCKLDSRENPGRYRAESAASLASDLQVGEEVVELGAIPYRSLHHLYRVCNIYVSPAYTETFAHPLVEAMSSGVPLVLSDLPVHREIAGDAALYFPRFSPEALAGCVLQICESPEMAHRLSQNGLRRAQDFSWEKHVQQLLALSEELVQNRGRQKNRD